MQNQAPDELHQTAQLIGRPLTATDLRNKKFAKKKDLGNIITTHRDFFDNSVFREREGGRGQGSQRRKVTLRHQGLVSPEA